MICSKEQKSSVTQKKSLYTIFSSNREDAAYSLLPASVVTKEKGISPH
jgi:hypothetical protein